MSKVESILAFTLLCFYGVVSGSDDILVSFPNTLKLGVTNNVVVYLNSSNDQKFFLEAYNAGNRVATTNKTVVSGSPTILSLEIDASLIDGGPTGSPCDGSLSLLVTCPALRLRRQVDVALDCSGVSVLIFTDKAVYTPGQTMSLRVACLDWTLKTYIDKLTIDIKNPQGIIIRRWIKTTTQTGLLDQTFTIDEEPQLGLWTIVVYSGKESKAMPLGNSSFEVKEYVVPRFGVSIQCPDYVKNSTKSFEVTVEAKYTYGEAVRGKVSIEFGALYEGKYRPVVPLGLRGWTKTLIDGQTTFDITLKKITDGLPYGFPLGARLRVKARVTSDGVGLSEETSVETTVFSVKSVSLDISRSRGFFKPGLPYDLEVLARKPNGVPVEGANIEMQAFVKRKGEQNWSQLTFLRQVKMARTTDADGFADFVFDIPSNSTKLKIQLKADGDSWTETELFSETSSLNDRYIMLRGGDGKSRTVHKVCSGSVCSQTHFKAYSSDNGISVNLCHMLICRGAIVGSGCRSVSSWPTQVSIELRPVSSPCCKLIAFYQTNGVYVADNIVVFSEMSFPNKVIVKPAPQKSRSFYLPNAPIDLEISGRAGSMVYLSIVDEGVLLLGDNRLTAVEVLNRMRGCKLGCESIGGRDANGIFKNAGLVYASLSRKIDYSPICFPPPKLEPTLPNLEACCERGVNHCKECEVYKKLLIDEGVHHEACINSFSECCERASKFHYCTLNGRGRNQGSSSYFPNQDSKAITNHRSYFPESWLNEMVVISDRGVTKLPVKVPDSITTWQVNAVGISPKGLYGMAEPMRLRVFSPIFLDVSVPYSVVRNEQFALKATVFNYNKFSDLDNVSVELVSRSFDVCTTAGTGKKTERQTVAELKSLSSHTFIFPVVPLSIGNIDLEVVLGMFFGQEAVKKTVKVKPEGLEQEISYSTSADPSAHRGLQNVSYDLSSPANAVNGSARSYFYATGNLLGPLAALEGFSDLLQQPYGCGEQNMVMFCPNVIVLLYMKRTSQLKDDLLTKGVSNIQHGYSRQLLFRRTNPPGSFSAFGDSDNHGSTWLTAFVLKSFCQVKQLQLPFEIVDRTVVHSGLKWLSSQQNESGEFIEQGRVLDVSLQGSVGTYECSMTCYVLISYLECSWSGNFSVDLAPYITRGMNYVANCVKLPDPCDHTFLLSISGYALCLANEKRQAAQTLGMLWNCAKINTRDETADWVGTSPTKAAAVETAAYAILGFTCMKNLSSAYLIANWLNAQRSLGGGFVSTQDTVVAIQALAAYAEKRHGKSSDLEVSVTSPSDGNEYTVAIGSDEANVRHSKSIVANSVIHVAVKGSGAGLLQAGVKYNTLQKGSKCNFSIAVQTNFEEPKNKLTITITVRYLGKGETGMAVVEVRLLSGFTGDEESLKDMINYTGELQRYDDRGEIIYFYFNQISNRASTAFSFKADRINKVAFLQPASIRVYDYYNPDLFCSTFYSPDGESPLLDLLCKGSACQCGAGKCPTCDKLETQKIKNKQRVDRDDLFCKNNRSLLAGDKRKVKLSELIGLMCNADFAYKVTVLKSKTHWKNGWTKVLGRFVKAFKPGIRDLAPGRKIRLWKRADCCCPNFRTGETYLYIGNDGPRYVVDFHSVVLKWDRKLFKPFLSALKDKALCE